jgi:hypothetical protein
LLLKSFILNLTKRYRGSWTRKFITGSLYAFTSAGC